MRRAVCAAVAAGLVVLAAGLVDGALADDDQAAPRWAVVVGVSAHTGRTKPAIGAAGDAADVTRVLRESGWPADHIVVLTGKNATAANIRGALSWLDARSTPDAFSVFHYSGHVKQYSGDRDRDGEKVDEFLWPSDNAFISDGELASRLRAVRGRLWVDIAGCESAGFNDGLTAPNRLLTSSSAETEKSYELPDAKRSVFVKLFVTDALLGGRGDSNGDGRISLREAYVYAADNAPRITRGQRNGPQHPHLLGPSGDDWYLAPPPPPPPPPPPRHDEPREEPPPSRCALLCL